MELKDILDKISESDEMTVRSARSVVPCKFEKMLFSIIIDSDWSFSTKSELSFIVLFFKIRFEPKEVVICVEFNTDITFPSNFKNLNTVILVLNYFPFLII
jgi:hypothetical protein